MITRKITIGQLRRLVKEEVLREAGGRVKHDVYVVTYLDYDDARVCGVFRTVKQAEEFVESNGGDENYNIEGWNFGAAAGGVVHTKQWQPQGGYGVR